MYSAGDNPGKGSYKCLKCGYVVVLESDEEVLPRCPKCNYTEFEKL